MWRCKRAPRGAMRLAQVDLAKCFSAGAVGGPTAAGLIKRLTATAQFVLATPKSEAATGLVADLAAAATTPTGQATPGDGPCDFATNALSVHLLRTGEAGVALAARTTAAKKAGANAGKDFVDMADLVKQISPARHSAPQANTPACLAAVEGGAGATAIADMLWGRTATTGIAVAPG
jgi:hypothetical protein